MEELTLLSVGGRSAHGPGAHVGLSGRCKGSFRTARVKVYPERMNCALAAVFDAYVHRLNPARV